MDPCPHAPNEMFARLRSAAVPASEKVALARSALSDISWTLPHKKTYLLQWLLEHDSPRISQSSNPCLIDQVEFWILLKETLSGMDSRDIMDGIPGSIIQSFVQKSTKMWPFLLTIASPGTEACASFIKMFRIISHRVTFEVIMDLLQCTLEGVISLEVPIPAEAHAVTLIISDDASRIIRQTSNHRKAAALIQDDRFITPLLRSLSRFGQLSSVGKSLSRLITDCIFSVDYIKRVLSNNTIHAAGRHFEWISVLRSAVMKDPQLKTLVIESLPFLSLGLINEQGFLQAHIFKASSTTDTSLEPKTTDQPANIKSSQDLVMYFMSSCHQLLRDLMTKDSGRETTEAAMTSLNIMITHIFTANIYSLADRYHYHVLNQVAHDCIEHLVHPSNIASKCFQTLSNILSIDCRIIEGRLPEILRSTVTATSEVTLVSEINTFLGSLIDWFSKAQRLSQLLSLLYDAVEWNLSKSALQTLLRGPLTSQKTSSKLRRELLLSASSIQLKSAHETAARRLLESFHSAASRPFTEIEDDRASKKLKKSAENPQSPDLMADQPSSTADSISPKTEVARCLYNCRFYIIVATAASRSLIQGGDQDQYNATLDGNLQELESALSSLCPDSSSIKQAKRKRSSNCLSDSPDPQIIAAAAFEVLNTLSEARPLHSDSRRTDLTRWLKVLRRAVGGKFELNPALTVQIIRSSLLQISASVSASGEPGETASLVYDLILRILDAISDSNLDHDWDGVYNPLTTTQMPCAMWYMFSTTHLSNFSDHATPEQLEKLATIILRCDPRHRMPEPIEDASDERVDECITFRKVNVTLLSSPSLHEQTRLCNSLLEVGLKSLDQTIALFDPSRDTTGSCKILDRQLTDTTSLLANLSRLPPDCLSKVTRTAMLQKCLDWNAKMLSFYIASATISPKDDSTQLKLTFAMIYSTRCCLSLVGVIETTADQSLLGKLLSVMGLFLSDQIDWQLGSKSDVLYEIAKTFIKQAISFVFRCTSGLSSSIHEEQTRLTNRLLSGVVAVSSQKSYKGSSDLYDGLVISAFNSVVGTLHHHAEKRSVPHHSVHQDWVGYVGGLVKNIFEAVKTLASSRLPLNSLQLELFKICFILARVGDLLGVESPSYRIPLDKVIAACSHTGSNLISSCLTPERPLALQVIAEMINMDRNRSAKSLASNKAPPIQSFQLLTALYVSSLVQTSMDAVQQREELKRQYQAACQQVSAPEYKATLSMLLEEYDKSLSCSNNTSLDRRGRLDSIQTLRALTETALIMMLNGPEGLGKCCQIYISAFLSRFQHPTFCSLRTPDTLLWQCQFLEGVCTAKINLIGRQDIALILETVLRTLSRDSSNESIPSELDIGANRRTCRKLYQSLVVIVSQISRHRREHVIPVFHLLMAILIAFLYPLCRPVYLFDGRQNGIKTVPSKMIRQAQRQFPTWSCFNFTTEAEWEKVGCGAAELAAYCRLLVSLGVKTTLFSRNAAKTDGTFKAHVSEQDKLRPAVISLSPPLSKHAPFYLKQYVKLCAGMSVRLPNQFHESLLPGISVLMNAMGKHERGSIGKMLSQPQQMSWLHDATGQVDMLLAEEGGDQELQKELWRKMLSIWETGRYKGVD